MEILKLIIDLIGSWPVFILIVLLIFREPLATHFFPRLKKLKINRDGAEVELESDATTFRTEVGNTQKELSEHPVSKPAIDVESKAQLALERARLDADIDNVLEAARTNPRVAVIQLSALIERELRVIVAMLGLPGPQLPTSDILRSREVTVSKIPPVRLGELLVGHNFLPQSTTASLKTFWQLYDRIIHGREYIHDDTILGILDSGVVLLERIRSIPHEIHVVHKTSIDLFSDKQCTELCPDVKGLIIESTTIGKTRTYKRIFPTTNWQYYQPQKQVTWEWNLTKSWKDTWYIEPDTSEKVVAWSSAGEFVGRHVEELM